MAARAQDLPWGGRGPAVPRRTERAPLRARRARARAAARRRLTTVAIVVVATLGLLLGGFGGTGTAARKSVGPRAVVVQPGDTLWGLAERYAPPGTDPRAYIYAIEERNALLGPLQTGMRIKLPK
ncbi:MAG TPA: LysM domain-containing protein [Actinomycetota bacterium]|nr:LysM domain-containing protein [Actinomycetota bacterium]